MGFVYLVDGLVHIKSTAEANSVMLALRTLRV